MNHKELKESVKKLPQLDRIEFKMSYNNLMNNKEDMSDKWFASMRFYLGLLVSYIAFATLVTLINFRVGLNLLYWIKPIGILIILFVLLEWILMVIYMVYMERTRKELISEYFEVKPKSNTKSKGVKK